MRQYKAPTPIADYAARAASRAVQSTYDAIILLNGRASRLANEVIGAIGLENAVNGISLSARGLTGNNPNTRIDGVVFANAYHGMPDAYAANAGQSTGYRAPDVYFSHRHRRTLINTGGNNGNSNSGNGNGRHAKSKRSQRREARERAEAVSQVKAAIRRAKKKSGLIPNELRTEAHRLGVSV